MNAIELRGVRTHNLKNFDLEIPYKTLTVITGVSGSGKSSLAFDTLYAEGQRRYVESISSYARQFLERMEKPELESIRGIIPAVAIEAKNVITNARSTVGTQTELNDYLRLLFARVGRTHCIKCGELVSADSPASVLKWLLQKPTLTPATIEFEIFLAKSTKRFIQSVREEYEKQGFLNIQTSENRMSVEVDTVKIDSSSQNRIADSLETAFRYGKGQIKIFISNKAHYFSTRFSCANCNLDYKLPSPNLFSFNSPLGACSTCQGFGRIITVDWNLVIPDPNKSISEGVIEPWTKPSASWELRQLKEYCKKKKISLTQPFKQLSAEHQRLILDGDQENDYFGVKDFFKYLEKKKYKMHVRILLSKYRGFEICNSCHGNRLRAESLAVRVGEKTIADFNRMSIGALRQYFDQFHLSVHEESIVSPILIELRKRIRFLDEVGLGYLTLDRSSRTLSGGEAQRINLATSLGSALVDTLYVLDEPSIGLHERDNQLLIRLLHELRDFGNTVVIVEHDRTVIEAADQIIDLGPRGGEAGGEIMYQGSFRDLTSSKKSLTAKYFRGELSLDRDKLSASKSGLIEIENASQHNLKNLTVSIPLHQLAVITGVSGSGKSTFLYDVLYSNYLRYRGRPVSSDIAPVKKIEGFQNIHDMLLIDQSPIGRTPRSNPATYIKAFDDIRKAFSRTSLAKSKRLEPGYFSFNVPGGRCEKCEGDGALKIEMHFLADVFVTCDACNGTRYQNAALEIRYKGKNIHDVLRMTVDEATVLFSEERAVVEKLSILSKMGLGYLRLGQPATTLSGGEAQRMKLASEMANKTGDNLLYLFDEPTTGLHYQDIAFLLSAFDELLKRGHSVWVIEHNMEVIKCADFVVDLGPDGGSRGGELVYAGLPNQKFLNHPTSYTGQCLKAYIEKTSKAKLTPLTRI